MKKKDEKICFITISIAIILTVVLITLALMWCYSIDKAQDNACKEIGFEENKIINNLAYCVDYNKNRHFIDFECEGFIKIDCVAIEINYSNARTINEVK